MKTKKATPKDIRESALKEYPEKMWMEQIGYVNPFAKERASYIHGRLDERVNAEQDAVDFYAWALKNVHNNKSDGTYILSAGHNFKTVTAKQLYKTWKKKK